jgi:hypothetical protein
MRREDLSIEWIPLKSTDLWFSLNWLNEAAWVGVPKLDRLVSWATPWCQEMPLPWAPSKRLNRSLVISKTVLGLWRNQWILWIEHA